MANRSQIYLIVSAVVIVFLVAALNYQAGREVSLLLFYLVPVVQTAWFVGTRAGITMAFICAAAWFSVNFLLTPNDLPPLVSLWNTSMRLGIFLSVVYIVSIQSALKRSLKKEKTLSRTDFLTGALNARAFSEAAVAEFHRASRYGHPFSIAYIDLDDFKTVNDAYGHTTGDLLLQTVVEIIRRNVRSTDSLARMGGDEFAVLIPESGDEAASVIVHKIQKKLAEIMKKNRWPVTASIGLVTYMKPPKSYDEMLKKVDGLMYLAKRSGKNNIKQEVIDQPSGKGHTE